MRPVKSNSDGYGEKYNSKLEAVESESTNGTLFDDTLFDDTFKSDITRPSWTNTNGLPSNK